MAAAPDRPPKAPRTQLPTLIGEVGFRTRNMFRKRAGRPRSTISKGGDTAAPTKATTSALRASRALPATRAPKASTAEAPARPPKKK